MAGAQQPNDIETAPPVQIDTSAAEAALDALQRKVRAVRAEMSGLPSGTTAAAGPLAQAGRTPASPVASPGGPSYQGGPRGALPSPAPGPGELGSAISAYRNYRAQTPPPAAAYASDLAAKPSLAAGYIQSAETLRLTRAAQEPGVFAKLGSVRNVARQFGISAGVGGLRINPTQFASRALGVAGGAGAIYALTKTSQFVADESLGLLNEQLRDPSFLDLTATDTSGFAQRVEQWAEDTGRSVLSAAFAPVAAVGRATIGAVGLGAATVAASLGAPETAREIAQRAQDGAAALDAAEEFISGSAESEWKKALSAAKRRAEEQANGLSNYMLGNGFPGTRRVIEGAVREIAIQEAENNLGKPGVVSNKDALVSAFYSAVSALFGATE